MKESIVGILSLWGIEMKQLIQINSSVWEVNHSYIIKSYSDKDKLERNIKISEILLDCNIPVANIVYTKAGEKYVEYKNVYFLMSKKMQGNKISNIKDTTIAHKMGGAIALLHIAFIKCEREIEFSDNSLLKEMKGWVWQSLTSNEWRVLNKEEYLKKVGVLESSYNDLPKQLIHRDVHFGNFLFFKGNLSGYIDFDLTQRNIRVFDICYFLTGLLAEKTDQPFTKNEWIEIVKSVITGYESVGRLTAKEKSAIPCVMECIEILFIAYYINMKDAKRVNDAYDVFRFIQKCESDIKSAIS